MDLTNLINDIVGSEDAVWAVAELSYSEFKDHYSTAIIVAQKYTRFLTNDHYDEQEYNQLMTSIRKTIDEKVQRIKLLFDQHGVSNYIPPTAQRDEASLIAPFSYKYAAVQAGLGWIGKSGVLVTRKFGPRVRLAAILVDYPFESGKPTVKSLCGTCHACVDACPWSVIKGIEWNPSTKRDGLLDYQLCNQKRRELIETSGRKHTCGYCILACPWGMK